MNLKRLHCSVVVVIFPLVLFTRGLLTVLTFSSVLASLILCLSRISATAAIVAI